MLAVASAALTTVFTRITPFAAFAVIAVTALSRWPAVALTLVLWLANQAVGYGVLHYPWNASSVAWGLAIGGACPALGGAGDFLVGRSYAFGEGVATEAFGVHGDLAVRRAVGPLARENRPVTEPACGIVHTRLLFVLVCSHCSRSVVTK